MPHTIDEILAQLGHSPPRVRLVSMDAAQALIDRQTPAKLREWLADLTPSQEALVSASFRIPELA